MALQFPVAKVLDFATDTAALRADPNPFALVTLAHVQAMRTRGAPAQRYRFKLELAQLLAERGWDDRRQQDLFHVLDWLLRLPRELDRAFFVELAQYNDRRHTMQWVNSYIRDERRK